MNKTPYWQTYRAIRKAAVKAIGKRGVAAIESLGDVGTLTRRREIAREFRRVKIKARVAEDAANNYASVHYGVFPEWRRIRREKAAEGLALERRAQYARIANGFAPTFPPSVLANWPILGSRRRALAYPDYGAYRYARDGYRTTVQLAERLEELRRAAVADTYNVAMHGSVSVEWVDRFADCTVSVRQNDDWTIYGRSCKYPAKVHTVTVRAMRAYVRDLPGARRDIDGLVTLGAEGIPTPDGATRAWRAVWSARAQGIAWRTEYGMIVEGPDGEIVHAKARPRFEDSPDETRARTLKSAMATLRRRRTAAQSARLARIGISRDEAVREHGARRLSWRIARRAGLCAPGIRAWCTTHFPDLDPRRDTVTVRDALATGTSEDLILRAVALVAARR